MLLGQSELILEVIEGEAIRRVPVSLLVLKGGKVLAMSSDTLALYKDRSSLNDPLGGGLIAMVDLPENAVWRESPPRIASYRAGFVAFSDNKALFITPKSFRLYANSHDALNNTHLICELVHAD